MYKYLTKYYPGYIIGTLLLVVTNLLGAYVPQLIKSAVEILGKLNPDYEAIATNTSAINQILIWIVVATLVMAVVRAISRQIIFGIGRQVEFDLKKEIFDHLITLQPSFFTEKRTGDLISIITNDVQSLRALGGFAMLNVINTIISFAIILPLMFKLHVQLTWAFLALIPIVIFFIISLSSRIKAYQTTVQEMLGEMSNFIEQNLSGIHIIKAYAQEVSEIKRFTAYNDALKDAYMKLISVRSFIGPVMRVIASLGFVLLLYIGGQSVINHSFSPGDLAAYSLYIQRLIWPVATLGWLITIIYRAQVSYQRISQILHTPPSIKDRAGAIDKVKLDHSIQLKSLGITINKGSNVAVIGTIGSGKSILAHKLMHIKELADDEILIDGIDLKNIKLNSLRTMINLVLQEDFLFSTSIYENIAYAKDLNEDEVIKLAKLVNIHDEIMKLPHGYQSIVGERGVTLSGGQRQRIAIARALALDSEVLMLDDALSSLDNASSALILKNILAMRQGRTTIFITHKIPIVKDMDQIIVMDKFKVVESGTHKELMNEGTLYKELVEHSYHE